MSATHSAATRRGDGRRRTLPRAGAARRTEDQPLPPGLLPLLRGADLGTRARSLWQVQRQAGNRAAQLVLQRQAVTDAQQWDQDWAAHPDQQRRFRGGGRPTGTPRQRYDVLAPLYKARGIPRPMVYLATSITTARFFDFETPAHVDLAAALRTAEATLRAGGVTAAPVTKVWALNPRTTSAGGWSNHADGRAVDIDPGTNPHLTSKAQRRIISLVTGTDMEAGGQGYDAMKNASDTFRVLYNPVGLRWRILVLSAAEARTKAAVSTATAERDRLRAERAAVVAARAAARQELRTLPRGRRATAEQKTRAAELAAVVQERSAALTALDRRLKLHGATLKKQSAAAKSAAQDRGLLEKHLARYEAVDSALAGLETEVAALPAAVAALEAQIARSRQGEQESRALGDTRGAAAERRLRAGLQKELKRRRADLNRKTKDLKKKRGSRDRDPLRTYGAQGFLNLPKELVEAMTGAGLRWGGNWKGAKDFMHFDL
ncbi:M15 family metallopeptidase [Kocuria sp. M1N1S27]|uniref:M15 family metallopeptidase n=1 Tax=Kocuria kalidii TaxID=3376283 RepID=UPI0037888634